LDTINIGKNGLTESVKKEILNRVKAKGLIRVKVLKSKKSDFEKIVEEVSNLPKTEVIKTIGFTVVLQKKSE
jgi:RNA-binding protein YhbY